MAKPDEDARKEDTLTCWCGATGTYEDLFDDSGLPLTCGGSHVLYCECGGDLCVLRSW